jgi:hypothetical protein
MVRSKTLAAVVGLVVIGSSDGCSNNFTPESLINSVRILAVQADQPYALPGATVSMSVLAFDGRPTKPEPMVISWLPQSCFNPPNDDYYGCFPAFASSLHSGVDLSSQLAAGNDFSFQLPADIISSHVNTTGGDPYGLAVVFEFACAGHVEYTPAAAGGAPDGVPFACFDATGTKLGADAFVFSYALVYSFNDRTNENPVINGLTYAGKAVDVDAGITTPHCTVSDIDDCPTTALDTVVPPSSQQPDPGTSLPGESLKEEIWVDYYLTSGKMKDDTEILYDPHAGALSGTADDLYAAQTAGDEQIWAVVHDNRGGVSWLQVTWHVQ